MHNSMADVAWAETNVMTRMATRMVGEEQYLGRNSPDLGTRVGEHAHELFTMIAPAETLTLYFERQSPTFIALHDIGAATSPALLAELGGALRQPVQTLTLRRQGTGDTLAMLRYIELPSSRGLPVRVWATASEADAATRRTLAETLLAFSRLGVLLVNALSDHMLVSQFGQLRERLLADPWPNRDLLLVPRAGFAHLADHAQRLVEGTLVATVCAHPTAQTAGVWRAIQGVWGRLRAGGSAAPGQPEPGEAPAAAPTITLRAFGSVPTAAATPAAPPAISPPTAAAAPAPTLAIPPAAGLDAASYAAACAAQPGVLACVVFDRREHQVLAVAGSDADRAGGCDAYVALLDAAGASALRVEGEAAPLELLLTHEHHLTLLRPLPAGGARAVALVLARNLAHVATLRTQLQRLDAQVAQ